MSTLLSEIFPVSMERLQISQTSLTAFSQVRDHRSCLRPCKPTLYCSISPIPQCYNNTKQLRSQWNFVSASTATNNSQYNL